MEIKLPILQESFKDSAKKWITSCGRWKDGLMLAQKIPREMGKQKGGRDSPAFLHPLVKEDEQELGRVVLGLVGDRRGGGDELLQTLASTSGCHPSILLHNRLQ
jgi:hypothetical protein